MTTHWSNKDNSHFYETNTNTLKHWAEIGGLAHCPDLIALKPYLKQAHDILEIGPGYGRVINYLEQHYPHTSLSAIEQSHQLCLQLKQDHPQITLFEADIKTFETTKHYDLVLWLWSGITDFAQSEQLIALEHAAKLLTPTGTLIVETFPHDLTPANGSTTDTQSYTLITNDSSLNGYIPSPTEIKYYAEQLALNYNDYITYTTGSGRERKLYPLRRSDTNTTT